MRGAQAHVRRTRNSTVLTKTTDGVRLLPSGHANLILAPAFPARRGRDLAKGLDVD